MTASLKQKLVKFFLDLYLFPIKLNKKLKSFVREVTLMDASEHLRKPISFLKVNHLIGKNPVIIDIGGANGDTTSFFLKSIPNCKVFIFEAIPELALQIKKRFLNQNVEINAFALSDKSCPVIFHITDNFLSSSYKSINENNQFQTIKSIKVPSYPLDFVMQKENNISEIDILKLDVQGAELDVLRGALQTLKKTKILIVEQSVRSPYTGGSLYNEVDDFLRQNEFALLDIVITYRKNGYILTEFDSIYINQKYNALLS